MKKYSRLFSLVLITLFATQSLFPEKKSSKFNILLFASSNLDEKYNFGGEDYAKILTSKISSPNFGVLVPQNLAPAALRTYQSGIWNELRLAREVNMNEQESVIIDAILFTELNNFSQATVSLPKFDRQVITYTLSSNYRLVSVSDGLTFAGDNVVVEKKIPLTSTIKLTNSEKSFLDELSLKIVNEITSSVKSSKSLEEFSLAKKQQTVPPKFMTKNADRDKSNQVEITISAELKNISMPEIIKGKDGQLRLSGNKLDIQPTDAFVEINGLVVGMCSKNKKLKVPSGLAKLKVSKAGFIPVEKMINAYDGFNLSVTLEPTPEEYNKWINKFRFLQEIKAGESLNQNQKKLTEGLYDFLRNSKYEVPVIDLN